MLYIAPLGSAGNHNASPRREGLERRNLASRSLIRACFGPINVEFRGGAICEAYRGRPAGLARSRRFVATAGNHIARAPPQALPRQPRHALTPPSDPQPHVTGRSRRILVHSSSPCKHTALQTTCAKYHAVYSQPRLHCARWRSRVHNYLQTCRSSAKNGLGLPSRS